MAEARSEILKKFREKIAAGKPIIGGAAGTGIGASFGGSEHPFRRQSNAVGLSALALLTSYL